MFLVTREITIKVSDGESLGGILSFPQNAKGIVVFAHGSGSSRRSPRNTHVSKLLNDSGIATLLVDLLSTSESILDEDTLKLRFDIDLLAERLLSVTENVASWPEVSTLPMGYFGASTGAAAAFASAAAMDTSRINAIVSRGGRPDLAKASLRKVKAATLLLVGGNDIPVIELNQRALQELKNVRDKRLLIVPGAGHNFEEAGIMEEVAKHACSWFERYLT